MSTPPGTTSPDRWGVVIAAGLAVFLAQLDASVVTVALPVIGEDLSARTAVVQWVTLGYVAPLIALSLCAGRWADTADPRRALTFATVHFAAWSIACGLAPGAGWLIAARVLQGCAAVVMMSLTPVLVTTAVRPGARARAFGLVMLSGTLGAMAGPLTGGRLVDAFGWPWIFYLNLPVVAVVLVLTMCQLPLGERLPAPRRAWLTEAATLGAGALALLLGLTLAVDTAAPWAALGLLAVPLGAGWARRPEGRPVRELLARPGVAGPHTVLLLGYLALFTVMFTVPFLLQDTLGATPSDTGRVMLAMAVATGVAGLLGGRAADRLRPRPVALAGALCITLALASLVLVRDSWGPADLGWRLALMGTGFGLLNGQLQVLAVNATPPGRLGTTAGTTNLARQLGLALGTACGAAWWAGATTGAGAVRSAALTSTALALVALTVLARTAAPAPRAHLHRPAAEPAAEPGPAAAPDPGQRGRRSPR
ncbi:MFS transporter [Streptomyces sp. NPDC059853]|uniref:MFS transporter n=1 Tax=Streptomyces sp. NPDC059853 TaxID=3346973 RepID=UPI003659F3DF